MNEDMSQYLGVFLDEANEQLERLEQEILKLEQELSPELLQEIFRAAHTLKGSSRAMGFTAMGELTHAMEDVFDKLRHDELTVSGALIDALFQGLDALKAMKEEIAATKASTLDTAEQTARLRAALESESPTEPSASAPASAPVEAAAFQFALSDGGLMALQDAGESGCVAFGLKIHIASDCIMKSVRALMVLQALERVGSVLATIPDEDAIENEAFENTFEILLVTQESAEALRAAACTITEIREAEVIPWEMPGAAPLPAAAPTAETPMATLPERAPEAQASRAMEDSTPSAQPSTPNAPDREEGRGKREETTSPTPSAQRPTPSSQAQTVRVDVTRLDTLLNLVGELVIDRTRIAQLGGRFERQYGFNELIENLNETAAHIGRITDELQEEIMKARMLPIDNVFNRFPRMVRDLAQKLSKEVEFIVEGKETELDRSVIEIIGDPLIHMLRNSVDHGIETPEDRMKAGKSRVGTVWLRARHEESHIVIEIQDDGKGIDPEKLRANAVAKGMMPQEAANRLTDKEAIHLIFASGFSTAEIVSDVSGRGVGMDIVKSNLQKLGAIVDIQSKVGVGTTFTVKLPLTLAIIRGLLVTVRGCVYAIPLASVVETIKVDAGSVHLVNHCEVIVQRGQTLPIVRLRDVFHLEAHTTPAERALLRETQRSRKGRGKRASSATQVQEEVLAEASEGQEGAVRSESLYLVIIGLADKRVGLVVDTLIGEQEIVIKTLGKFIGDIKGISGATILGDGRVALIVDANGLITIAIDEKGKANAA
jgi:two-component system chemotaxis sensor kinase CheA